MLQTHRFSRNAKSRKPNALTSTFGDLLKNPDLVSVGPGDLHRDLIPFESLTVKLKDGSSMVLDSKEMYTVSAYGFASGYGPLVQQLRQIQMKNHATSENILSKPNQWSVMPVCGAMEGASKAFEMLLDQDDSYVIEIPAFPPIFDMLCPLSTRAICCTLHEDGLHPDEVRAKIEAAMSKGWPVPKLLYTCATVSNPTGVSSTAKNRREIYKLACEFNFYIVEDDPYYFLKFNDAFYKDMPSYLSLDTEGRVIRLDSFSKIVSGGFRLGYVTAATSLIQQLALHVQTSSLHASQLAQAVISAMLRNWGEEGFLKCTRNLIDYQRRRLQVMLAAAERHLGVLIEYQKPVGGIFLWFKIKGIEKTAPLVLETARKGALFVSGSIFLPEFAEIDSEQRALIDTYIRASYSLATEEQIDLAFKRLREAVDEHMKRCNK